MATASTVNWTFGEEMLPIEQAQPQLSCSRVEQLKQGGVAQLVDVEGQRPLQSRQRGRGA